MRPCEAFTRHMWFLYTTLGLVISQKKSFFMTAQLFWAISQPVMANLIVQLLQKVYISLVPKSCLTFNADLASSFPNGNILSGSGVTGGSLCCQEKSSYGVTKYSP